MCVGGRGRGCSWIWGSEMISGSRSLDLEAMESLPLSEWNVRFRMPKNGSGVGARGSQGCLPPLLPQARPTRPHNGTPAHTARGIHNHSTLPLLRQCTKHILHTHHCLGTDRARGLGTRPSVTQF